jgi:hypothetical protein
MEQHVAKLLICHHQFKHFLYNLPFMYYSKYPYDDFLIKSKYFDPLKIQLCPLLLTIYWKELNIHGYRTELMWSWWPTMLN